MAELESASYGLSIDFMGALDDAGMTPEDMEFIAHDQEAAHLWVQYLGIIRQGVHGQVLHVVDVIHPADIPVTEELARSVLKREPEHYKHDIRTVHIAARG
jgi:hypothetical protein